MKSNILTKEEFVKAINNIKRTLEFEDKVYHFFHEYDCSGPEFPFPYDDYILTLNRMFYQEPSQYDYGLIDYFCIDLAFGKDYEPGCYKVNKVDVDISTPELLYDELIRDMKNKEDNEEHDDGK